MAAMNGIAYEYRGASHEVSHAYLKPCLDKLVDQVPTGAHVLDLGCGNGSFISLFRNRGWILHGTDFSPTGIDIAKHTFPDVDFILADASSPAGDIAARVGLVDLIISTEVVEHLYNPRGFLKNSYDLLKSGGQFVLTTPYHGYLKNLSLALTGKMDKHFTALWDHGHIKFWSAATLSQALREAGFRDLKMVGAGRLPYLWKSMVFSAKK
jgi:2-polyprenyl-3-methyl-5-hydroxy-6-metoxy-1,4-benzoquinol methylase